MGLLDYGKTYLSPLLQVQILPQLNVVSSSVGCGPFAGGIHGT